MARLRPFSATARLQQGIALDARYGIGFDGLLCTLTRDRAKAADGHLSGSLLDGGASLDRPVDIDLPLARCEHGPWHWVATTAYPLGWDMEPLAYEPDVHHLRYSHQREIAEQVAMHLPTHVPLSKGRFRSRRLPVVTFPAPYVQFRGVGDIEAITGLLEDCHAIGAHRHAGEGAILEWAVIEHDVDGDPSAWGHTHIDGTLGRPVPTACADQHRWTGPIGEAGLRPPVWHPARRHPVVQPTYHQET